MHFPASWQTLAKETPADIPLLSCSSIVKFCCLRNKSALCDLGAGLYAVQSVENHACRCGPEGRDRPPDLITQAVLNAIESTGLRGAGGLQVRTAGQELLQAQELRGPGAHDAGLPADDGGALADLQEPAAEDREAGEEEARAIELMFA